MLVCSIGLFGCGAPPGQLDDEATNGDVDSDDGSESETDSGDSGTTGPPWGEPVDPCADVTCSDHGTCVVIGALASCECEDGFFAKRHECIACTPISEDHVYDIDVPMITLQPELTVDGAAPPDDLKGDIDLISDSDLVGLLYLWQDPSPVSVIPGVYDVRFYRHTWVSRGESLPLEGTVVLETDRIVDASGEFLVDLPVVTVTASLLVDGEIPNPPDDTSWDLSLFDPYSPPSIQLDEIGDYTVSGTIVRGIYDLVYSAESPLPENEGAVMANDAFIAQSGHIVVDIGSGTHSGALTIGGQVLDALPPGSEGASLSLISPELGRVDLGDPGSTGEYSVRLIPGTYDLLYEQRDEQPGLPDNEHAILATGLVFSAGEGTTDIDIPIVTRSGALTLEGVPVAANEWGAELYYVNRTTGDRVLISDLAWGEYDVEMIPGVYDLIYELHEPRPGLPANEQALIATNLVIDESGTLDIDVPMITVTGSLTVNGQVVGSPNGGYVSFRATETGGLALAGDISLGAHATNLIPGVYDVVYWRYQGPLTPPMGHPANLSIRFLQQIPLDESGNFDIDVPAVTVTGSITINGESVAGGVIHVLDPGGHRTWLGRSDEPYSTFLIPGTYTVVYGHDEPPDPLAVPSNYEATLDCIVIE